MYTVTNDGVAHKVSRAGTTDVGRVCEGPGALGMLARADGAAFLVRCIGSSTDEDALAIRAEREHMGRVIEEPRMDEALH